jgi:hypothetical protein
VDIQLYLRVLWRWKYLVAAGVVVGCGLAYVAVTHRAERYRSHTTVFVTQPGFPWGRSGALTEASANPDLPSPQGLGDPQRLSTLTALYAKLAVADEVQHGLLARSARTHESISVVAEPAPAYSTPAVLPLLTINGTAPTAPRAVALAERATTAFIGWLQKQQTNADIPDDSRVVAQIVNHATRPEQVSHHSKALPVMIALTVIAAFVGLALVLENLMPSERRLPAPDPSAVPASRLAA